MIGTIIMTQKGKKTKTQKTQMHFFSTILPKNIYGNICILSHKFWMNQGSDLLSTLKWPSKPQFCERYWYSRQKNDQKWSYRAIYEFSFVSDQSIDNQCDKFASILDIVGEDCVNWVDLRHEQRSLESRIHIMAFPVVEFSRQGYKIRKVFG